MVGATASQSDVYEKVEKSDIQLFLSAFVY